MSLFSITLSLILLMDPIGNVPLYISVLKGIDHKRQMRIIVRELLIALAVIVAFSLLGDHILRMLHVSQQTTLIAGGLILFIMAIRMIFPQGKEAYAESPEKGEPFIVPLAIPLVAGPSVLAAVMIYSDRESHWVMLGAITMAWIVTFLILIIAPFLKKILGIRGVVACERLMGLILTLLAVQMFVEGLAQTTPSLNLQTFNLP